MSPTQSTPPLEPVTLADLLRGVEVIVTNGPTDVTVGAVRDDSRKVSPGDVFVAVSGLTVDGHAYLADAEKRGAKVAVVEREGLAFAGTLVQVKSTAAALAVLAAHRFGDPGERLRLVGVTGTNGKTTTTYLVESMLLAGGRTPGVIGTVTYRHQGPHGRVERPAPFTTPGPLELQETLAGMLADGCTDVVMETSSHALAQGRLAGLQFAVAAFTNLTQDHLDFHKTMEAYFEAKALLYSDRLAVDGVGVALIDDPSGARILERAVGRKTLRCTIRRAIPAADAEVRVVSSRQSIDGIHAEIATPRGTVKLHSPLIGEYNLANITGAVGIAEALGLPLDVIAAGIGGLAGVPGRVERVANQRGIGIVVDYAHTPDALERVIAALRPLVPTSKRLLTVFGCGGDRDRTKRPKMGAVAARESDIAIVTSDNPRTEDPLAIIAMICEGVTRETIPALHPEDLGSSRRGFTVLPDRRDAIGAAIRAAHPGDIVLIAGKGHEDYQILGKEKIHFDDREEARAALESLA
jgi:UDP-N-acetylmuramyl-tripeptide synthetase